MANERKLGDLYEATQPDGKYDASDIQMYTDAINANCSRTILSYDSEHDTTVMNDVENGGLNHSQSSAVSLHQNGYASDLDKMLLSQYVDQYGSEAVQPDIREFITRLDTSEIIPPVDPPVETLQELRDDVTANICDLKIYQGDKLMELQSMAAKSLNDLWEKTQRLWCAAYTMDYDTIAKLDGEMNQAKELPYPSEYDVDSGWNLLQPEILEKIYNLICGTNALDRADLITVRDTYIGESSIEIHDPVTQDDRDKMYAALISISVKQGVSFYDNYKNHQGSGGGGGDDPSQSLVPEDPASAPAASGDLLTFIDSCNDADVKNQCINAINNVHTNQIITVKHVSGSPEDVVVSCYEVNNGAWVGVYGLTNLQGKVGRDGIISPSLMDEAKSKEYDTPAGAWRLGNYSTNSDDVGAFGANARSDLTGINYKKIESTMYWIDGSHNQPSNMPSWYNTFYDSAQNPYHLIQWERDHWTTEVYYNHDGTQTYAGSTHPFEPGKYYASVSLLPKNLYSEKLIDHANDSYRNAIVIRYNMIPHVVKPVTPGDKKSGSAFFLHSFSNDSSPSYTYGCVAVDNDKMLLILSWYDRTKSPYIFIGL